MLFTCLSTFHFTWGPQGPPIPYLKAYLVFLPCLRLLSIAPIFLSFFQVPKAIPWALICLCKPSHNLPALMAWLKGTPMLICACPVHAAYFGIFFLVGLGLGASHWLTLGVICFLPLAGGFIIRLASGYLTVGGRGGLI